MPARPSNAAQAAADDARFDSFAVRWLTGGKRRGAGGKAQKASEMTVTPEQCKAGRELLGWSRIRLAFRVGVSEKTVLTFESGEHGRDRSTSVSFAKGSKPPASSSSPRTARCRRA